MFTEWQFDSVFWVTGFVELKSKRPINKCVVGTQAKSAEVHPSWGLAPFPAPNPPQAATASSSPKCGLRIALPTARKTVGSMRSEYVPEERLGDEHYKRYAIRKHRNLIG